MSDLLEFGPFKLVLPDGDLYKGRNRIRLQQHPLTLLVLLVEPDGKWIFYGRVDQLESNIMLAEGLPHP